MKLFFISVLLMGMSFLTNNEECDQLKFDINIVHTTSGLANGIIEVSVIKSASKVRAFLYGDKKSKNRLNVRIDKLNKLQAGTYLLVLQNNDCSTVKRNLVVK
jgi:hypothetical protein